MIADTSPPASAGTGRVAAGSPGRSSEVSVPASTLAGSATALTVMPRGPSSRAATFTSERTPSAAVLQPVRPAEPRLESVGSTVTIAPPPSNVSPAACTQAIASRMGCAATASQPASS